MLKQIHFLTVFVASVYVVEATHIARLRKWFSLLWFKIIIVVESTK